MPAVSVVEWYNTIEKIHVIAFVWQHTPLTAERERIIIITYPPNDESGSRQ